MNVIPKINDLYESILSNLETELAGSIPRFGKNYLRARSAVQAGKLWLFYIALGKVQKNIFIDTAEPESMGGALERFGRIKLNRSPFAAKAGKYNVTVTGSTGGTIPAGTTFKSNDDAVSPGKLFVLDTAFTLAGSSGTINLRAMEGGLGSKLVAGNKLTATIPIALVTKEVSVTSESLAPVAAEDLEDYRQKAIQAYRLEPQGGADADFRLWAADAQGVKQTYPYARSGYSAEVNLFIEATIVDSVDGKGTPTSAIINEVESVIELDPDTTKPMYERGRRPLGVHQVHYLPVTIKTVKIEIDGFAGWNSSIQSLFLNALKVEIEKIRPYISGVDVLDQKNDILDKNKIIMAILTARPGSIFTNITLKVNDVPMNSYTFLNGEIPYLDSFIHV